ncbi:MAG: hypothetical protein ABUL49_00730, partial [bacterium]
VIFLSCLGTGLALGAQDRFASVGAEGGEFHELGQTVRVVGVCQMDPDKTTCWDSKGKADPSLSERVRAYYLVNDVTFPVAIGVKNRYLVMSNVADLPNTYADIQPIAIAGRTGNVSNLAWNSNGSGPRLTWYHAQLEKNTNQFNAVFNLTTNIPTTAILPMKDKARIALDKGTVTLEGWKEAPKDDQSIPRFGYTGSTDQKFWVVRTSLEGLAADASVNLGAVDAKGNPIVWVDTKGNPTPTPKASRAGANAIFAQFRAGEYATNIDPAKIGGLKPTMTRSIHVTFSALPADLAP